MYIRRSMIPFFSLSLSLSVILILFHEISNNIDILIVLALGLDSFGLLFVIVIWISIFKRSLSTKNQSKIVKLFVLSLFSIRFLLERTLQLLQLVLLPAFLSMFNNGLVRRDNTIDIQLWYIIIFFEISFSAVIYFNWFVSSNKDWCWRVFLFLYYWKLVGGEHQRRLLQNLFDESKYNQLERPVQNDSDTLHVAMSLALQQIIDFVSQDEKIFRFDFFLLLK